MTPDQLRTRVIEAKKLLPNSIIPIFITKYPKFNTKKQIAKVTNVIHLRTISEPITKKLENLALLLAPEKF